MTIEDWLASELERLLDEANKGVEAYWKRHYENKAKAARTEWGSYGVRARINQGSLAIDWYRLRKANVRSGDKTVMITEHVPRGRGYRHSVERFRKAVPWEREMIGRLEEEFAGIRRRATALNKVRGALKRYRNLQVQATRDESPAALE